jgi:hypothetical protein
MLYFIPIIMVETIVLSGLLAGVISSCRKNPLLAIALTGVCVLNVLNYDMMRNNREILRPGLVGVTGIMDKN